MHSVAISDHGMSATEATGTITVKPHATRGWIMVTPRLHSEIYFHGRQRALMFARAYARLNRPARLRVLDEAGGIVAEEVFEDLLRESGHATPRAKPMLVMLARPSS